MSDGDGWPYYGVGDERPPLDPMFWTEDGFYYCGYLDGQKGRHLKGTSTDDLPERYIEGITDGYGDFLGHIDAAIHLPTKPTVDEFNRFTNDRGTWWLTGVCDIPKEGEYYLGFEDNYVYQNQETLEPIGVIDHSKFGKRRWIVQSV